MEQGDDATTCSGGSRPPLVPLAKRTSTPSPFASTELSTRRLRSNSGGPLPHEEYLRNLSTAEMNSIAPPMPIYKIVLTGGPCGGKTTALARVRSGESVLFCPLPSFFGAMQPEWVSCITQTSSIISIVLFRVIESPLTDEKCNVRPSPFPPPPQSFSSSSLSPRHALSSRRTLGRGDSRS